jgi:hypothetical protein
MGATETRRSSEIPGFSSERRIFPAFSIGAFAGFLRILPRFGLAAAPKRYMKGMQQRRDQRWLPSYQDGVPTGDRLHGDDSPQQSQLRFLEKHSIGSLNALSLSGAILIDHLKRCLHTQRGGEIAPPLS